MATGRADKAYALGTVEASERLIHELYIDLKQKVNKWASLTRQTAQARMGYVGQHLVSVATGFPGGRSGARGKDLVLPNSRYAEIKTCYRVDQLGKCGDCGGAVSSLETACPECSSGNIERKDDSKWLIGIRHDDEFAHILDPASYYLVLFDFTDLAKPTTIRASIWRVDSLNPGFAYCLVDYYFNIRKASKSKAPFNLWPFQLKFDLMKPLLIYRSLISADNTITTEVFPSRDKAVSHPLKPLPEYSQSQNLTADKCKAVARLLKAKISNAGSKREILAELQTHITHRCLPQARVADALAYALYWPHIKEHTSALPQPLRQNIENARRSIVV
ncbi:MAG: MamI family restriction endonuclease [Deltaproteobacteria bacterium]|nr:MamI family restriction endonuclease [Deltaproteobacteria bacterium]